MRAIKNSRSWIEISKIFEQLQQVLVKHGARQITFDYGQDGKIYGVTFSIEVPGKVLIVRLPARVENVHTILEEQRQAGLIKGKLDQEQAYRVAWRNLLDWVVAQMTLLEIEMVRLEEVFLPYVVNDQGKSLFEVFEAYQFQLPLRKRNSLSNRRTIASTAAWGDGSAVNTMTGMWAAIHVRISSLCVIVPIMVKGRYNR